MFIVQVPLRVIMDWVYDTEAILCSLKSAFSRINEKFTNFFRLFEFFLVLAVPFYSFFLVRYNVSNYFTCGSGIAPTVVELITVVHVFSIRS